MTKTAKIFAALYDGTKFKFKVFCVCIGDTDSGVVTSTRSVRSLVLSGIKRD